MEQAVLHSHGLGLGPYRAPADGCFVQPEGHRDRTGERIAILQQLALVAHLRGWNFSHRRIWRGATGRVALRQAASVWNRGRPVRDDPARRARGAYLGEGHAALPGA